MTIETTGLNPTLINDKIASLLIAPLEEASSFLSCSPRVIDTNQPLRVPRIASGINAGFVKEGELIGDDSIAFDEVTLLPSSLASIKTITRVSNELIRTSVVGALDSVLQNRLVTDVSNALDQCMWDGDGVDDTVLGILQAPDVATGVLDLSDADSIIDGIATAQANKVNPSHIVMTSASFSALRKLKVGSDDSRYLFDPSTIQNGTSFSLFGLPVVVSDYCADVDGAARVALVDFSHVIVARDLASDVKVLSELYADYDSVGIRVVSRWDVALAHPQAVTILTEAGTPTGASGASGASGA